MMATGKCWMMKAPRGWLGYVWASRTRRNVIDAFMKDCPPAASWRQMYRKGWRVVRVTLREI